MKQLMMGLIEQLMMGLMMGGLTKQQQQRLILEW
jgi:hypothetical protein